MMLQVTRCHPGKSPHAEAYAVGDTLAVPSPRNDPTQQQQIGFSQQTKFRNDVAEIAQAVPAVGVFAFVPTGQLGRVAGGESHHPVTQGAFRHRTMLEHLANRPSEGRMDLVDLFGAQMTSEFADPIKLTFQDAEDAIAVDLFDQTPMVIRLVFVSLRTAADKTIHQMVSIWRNQ